MQMTAPGEGGGGVCGSELMWHCVAEHKAVPGSATRWSQQSKTTMSVGRWLGQFSRFKGHLECRGEADVHLFFFFFSFILFCLSVIQWTSKKRQWLLLDFLLLLCFFWVCLAYFIFLPLIIWVLLMLVSTFLFMIFFSPLHQTYHCLNSEKMSRHLTFTQLQIKQNNITVMHFSFCF